MDVSSNPTVGAIAALVVRCSKDKFLQSLQRSSRLFVDKCGDQEHTAFATVNFMNIYDYEHTVIFH